MGKTENHLVNNIEEKVWEKIRLARHPKRPTASFLIKQLFPDFIELHGDRQFGDDTSLIGGLATFMGQSITVIAQEKGSTTDEKIARNFGMPHPEGYRKALRLMKQAEKFHRPIVFIIDTPGAYPGIGAEERGQAQAIAFNLFEMIAIQTPMIGIVLSEGGSGGALAIGVTDTLLMLENSVYSIISPEGFASILFKDSTKAKAAAALMKLTADDLLSFGIIDAIVPEAKGGFHEDIQFSLSQLRILLQKYLKQLFKLTPENLLKNREKKFRAFGVFEESNKEKNHGK
jgi:acetyl-CoA carboxylase carboxyl transferase subunit alpha